MRTNKIKTQLVGSAPSKEMLINLINAYFFSSNGSFKLLEDLENESVFTIWYPENSKRAGKQLKDFIVVCKKGRYRFERIVK